MGTQLEITDLLTELRNGRREAMDQLLPLVYDELRRIAHRTLGPGRTSETLGTTALVHEAYLKLVNQSRAEWNDRVHFFAVAATAMRQLLVDHARARSAVKRGGGRRRVSLDETQLSVEEQAETLLELDQALTKLSRLDERLGRVVECRFFGGLTEEETAEVLGVTARTVRRDWVKAKGLLYEELSA
ncbi:MAG: sigma-70 family RNA polymerase sigma factor [Gemmatimonadales bacterium]